jgi:hypothetical protein
MRLKEQKALFGGSWLEEPAAAAVAASHNAVSKKSCGD